MKYICITGGVMSGIGKGVIASSTGMLMKQLGLSVTAIKIDPYINIDAGTMSPFEHGEVFVLSDGGEVDLDLGNYERFMDITLHKDNNITTGKIYNRVIEKERKGGYLGKTVQVVPHVVNEIQDWIERVAKVPVENKSSNADDVKKTPDVCVIELGGTVGDIESMPFIEALRQFQFRVGKENFCLLHVSLIPITGDNEQKTKPTQSAAKAIRSLGLFPDFIMCRSAKEVTAETKEKISTFCHVDPSHVIGVHDVSNLYGVPLLLEQQQLTQLLRSRLQLDSQSPFSKALPSLLPSPKLDQWRKMSERVDQLKLSTQVIHIAFVGKYTNLLDSYKSMVKALHHAAMSEQANCKIEIKWIESSHLEEADSGTGSPGLSSEIRRQRLAALMALEEADGILIPGGFGDRGVEGKVRACAFAREHGIPYFGICLGMQVAVIEICRALLHWPQANSEEFDDSQTRYSSTENANLDIGNSQEFIVAGNSPGADATQEQSSSSSEPPKNVIVFMPEISETHMGGTMRLGERTTVISKTVDSGSRASLAFQIYRQLQVDERHRHRYEVNPDVVEQIEAGTPLRFTGRDLTAGVRMEIAEITDPAVHPFFLGVQYHPEFLSHPTRPSPPFVAFVTAARQYHQKNRQKTNGI